MSARLAPTVVSAHDPVTSALATLRATRQNLATQLEATDRAIAALVAVSGTTATPIAVARAKRRNAKKTTATESAPLKSGKAGSGAAAARNRAVLAIIARGVGATSLITGELPIAEGATTMQHATAVRNALTRLRADGQIRRGDRGWEVTAKGRRTLGAEDAAKEEP